MFGRKKYHSDLYEDLHACKDCEDCKFYELQRDIFAFSAYCNHPKNWHEETCYSTENPDKPIKGLVCKNGPDENNSHGQCEWKNDDCEPFSIIDKSSEGE